MITWDEFKDQRTDFRNLVDQKKIPTAITCPKCGEMVYRDDSIIYVSMPPKHKYFCEKCGWSDFA